MISTKELPRLEIKKDLIFPLIKLEIDCSKGTYIRQLAYDIGQDLGTVGMLCSLKRTRIGQVKLKQAITIEELQNTTKLG
jgi:tRNA pseudouridine55 synthase